MDNLGLEQAVDGFDEGIVVGIADAADGRLDPCLGQAFSVADRDVPRGYCDERGYPGGRGVFRKASA